MDIWARSEPVEVGALDRLWNFLLEYEERQFEAERERRFEASMGEWYEAAYEGEQERAFDDAFGFPPIEEPPIDAEALGLSRPAWATR